MIIALACLGSFVAGIAVGMLYWYRIERKLNEAIEKNIK